MKIEKGSTVIVKKLLLFTDKSQDEILVNSRKLHKVGIVDSPIYLTLNHFWLVRHDTSTIRNGISVGYYGVYHEDELETIDAPPSRPEIRDSGLEWLTLDDDLLI